MTTVISSPASFGDQVRAPRAESLVPGITCRHGHFNADQARWCAICGSSLVGRQSYRSRSVRPAVGVLVADDGSTIPVARSIEIAPTRRRRGQPTLLEGLDGRAAIRVKGWLVFLVARSEAGVEVQGIPLQAGQPVPLSAGTRFRVGDRGFTFESLVNSHHASLTQTHASLGQPYAGESGRPR